MLIRFLNYVVILSLGLFAACVPFERKQAVIVNLPTAEVTWQSADKYCVAPTPPSPVILESLNDLLPEACEPLPSINGASNALQLFCLNNAVCTDLAAHDVQQLPDIVPANTSYKALQKAQQDLNIFDQDYAVLHVATLGAIDGLIKHGLRSFEQTGLNPYTKAVIASVNSSLITGVWPQANSIPAGLEAGQSYVTTEADTSLLFGAGFTDLNCDSAAAVSNIVDTAPESAQQLNFISHLEGVSNGASSYIVKHWLDLSGQLHRITLSVNTLAGCSVIHDKDFDSAYASAYFLVVKNTAATTPIWYLPPRG